LGEIGDWKSFMDGDSWRYSCTHKAQQEDFPNQVQGPLLTTPVHTRLEGFGEGREVEAIAATEYVSLAYAMLFHSCENEVFA